MSNNRVSKNKLRGIAKGPLTPGPSPCNKRQLKQYILSVGSKTRRTCAQCGMSYLVNSPSDVKLHDKFHRICVDGRDWNMRLGEPLESISQNEAIYKVDSSRQYECIGALEMLNIVNKELNAPDDNDFWTSGDSNGSVYVYVRNKVAVGIVSVERFNTNPGHGKKGYWFSVEDGRVVSPQPLDILCGISRIYVCRRYRRHGIAIKLLHAVQRHLIYGLVIPSLKIAWSQPSTSGGQLAMRFNGRMHKSGKVLIPVYT